MWFKRVYQMSIPTLPNLLSFPLKVRFDYATFSRVHQSRIKSTNQQNRSKHKPPQSLNEHYEIGFPQVRRFV